MHARLKRLLQFIPLTSAAVVMGVCADSEPFEPDDTFAKEFAADWIDAWNTHDLDRILAHYSDDIEFTSPFVVQRGIDPNGTVVGKQALTEYWGPALTPESTLRFELINVLVGVKTVAVLYLTNAGGVERQAVEVFHFNDEAQVNLAYANYGNLPEPRGFAGIATDDCEP